jgi:DNA-binding beta-propeller fold protein YncE
MIVFKWTFMSIALACLLAASFVAPYAFAQQTSSFTINGNSLFVGDQTTCGNTDCKSISQFVKLVDVQAGATTNFATSNINGPRGIIFTGPISSPSAVMLVANQAPNVNQPGDIAMYRPSNGNFLNFLVPQSDPNAPHIPRGIVLSPDHSVLYVADLSENMPSGKGPGLIRAYIASGPNAGHFIASYSAQTLLRPGDQFNPKGLVFGPDGLLYISVFDTRNSSVGYILAFNPSNQQFKILVANPGSANTVASIHRPEGIVFDPSGKSLWVTSFCPHDPTTGACLDVDKIMEFGTSGLLAGHFITAIPLESSTNVPRTFAEAILFGPNLGHGNLYVPITNTGELRVCDTSQLSCTSVAQVEQLPPGSPPLLPLWYLSFRGTDPSTLAFTTP